LVLALTGCATEDNATPRGQCAAQAYDDPAVKDIRMRGLGNPDTAQSLQPELNDAVHAATLRCLRARGLIAPGGVEKEKPPS
jgi:hypothetical protein